MADGGGFFSGEEEISYRSFATSWTHILRPELINEFRLGYNRINSRRLARCEHQCVRPGQSTFRASLFRRALADCRNLPSKDGSAPTLGSPTFLPSVELQNSYTLSENLTWVKGAHTLSLAPRSARGIHHLPARRGARQLGFGTTLTDNAAYPGSGGTALSSSGGTYQRRQHQ